MNKRVKTTENRGKIQGAELSLLIFDLLASFPEKNQDIVKRRFGLSGEEGQTLEAIGKYYGITRERVRQIEAATLKSLKENPDIKKIEPIETAIASTLNSLGGIAPEESLLKRLLRDDFNNPTYCRLVLFILNLSDKFFDFSENSEYNRAWTIKRGFFKRTNEIIETAKEVLQKVGEPVTFGDLYQKIDAAPVETSDLNREIIENYLGISKKVISNPYQDWGLAGWGEINPRGVKDRAYIVLKKDGKPLHFQQITDLINKSQLSQKRAHAPTVHNELIKDPRFVLVGRGIYGLAEWGYKQGTVKEIIIDILKKAKKPVSREKLVDLVLKQRIVRRSTVLLNLQDSSLFARDERGEVELK